MDYLTLSSVPCDEPCIQVHAERNYVPAMRHEAHIFRSQLERLFPIPDHLHCRFSVKSFPHDFGPYMEVVINFDDQDEEAASFAYHIENELPSSWDALAKQQLLSSSLILDLYKQQNSPLPSSL